MGRYADFDLRDSLPPPSITWDSDSLEVTITIKPKKK